MEAAACPPKVWHPIARTHDVVGRENLTFYVVVFVLLAEGFIEFTFFNSNRKASILLCIAG
jgi:hypothetical protein